VTRLSIPGNACVHCGTTISQDLECPGCGWIDPLTKQAAKETTIEERYEELCRTPSDINEHLPVLRLYADRCEHVTEFGVRGCVSLHAFLASKAKKVTAYDIANVAVPECEKLTFINADVLAVSIDRTDMLFIDTLHTADQLRDELDLHSAKVQKYLAFHDTAIYGEHGEDGGPGLNGVIAKFLIDVEPWWRECYRSTANNGLTILERK
jgi:hypothetical protein